MCLQDAQDYIASLSKTQLVHLCTGVPDVRSRTTEMAKILEPLRNSPDSYFVLPGGPVQVSLHLLTILLLISHPWSETLCITMLNKH